MICVFCLQRSVFWSHAGGSLWRQIRSWLDQTVGSCLDCTEDYIDLEHRGVLQVDPFDYLRVMLYEVKFRRRALKLKNDVDLFLDELRLRDETV